MGGIPCVYSEKSMKSALSVVSMLWGLAVQKCSYCKVCLITFVSVLHFAVYLWYLRANTISTVTSSLCSGTSPLLTVMSFCNTVLRSALLLLATLLPLFLAKCSPGAPMICSGFSFFTRWFGHFLSWCSCCVRGHFSLWHQQETLTVSVIQRECCSRVLPWVTSHRNVLFQQMYVLWDVSVRLWFELSNRFVGHLHGMSTLIQITFELEYF